MKAALLVLGVLLAAPLASAAALELSTHHPARISGEVVFEMPEANVISWSNASHAPVTFAGATGRIEVWTWRMARATFGEGEGLERVDVEYPTEEPASVAYAVDGADVVLDPQGGAVRLVAVLEPGAVARLRGAVHGDVVPALRGEERLRAKVVPVAFGEPPIVRWDAAPDWHYVGNFHVGMPDLVPDAPEGVIEVEGPLRLQADEGVATFVDRDGKTVRVELGAFPESPGVEVRRRLIFEGTLAPSTLPHGEQAALSAPTATWRVDGSVAWPEATGATRDPDATFEDADVLAVGALTLQPTPGTVATYAGEGDVEVLVDGVPVGAPVTPVAERAQEAAWWIAALAALAILARLGFFALYARLGPEDVLLHPRRRALWDAVQARPGMRKRDLQHALGFAWGAFSFHLRVLVSSGHVRVQREGTYSLVVPAAARGHVAIAHPSTRAVYEALPGDGSALRVGDLRKRVGYSRQRLDHHVRTLEERGLVRVVREPAGERQVARARDE